MIRKIQIGGCLLAVLGLAGCVGDDPPTIEVKREIVVVKPDASTYAMCPQTLDIPPVTDTYSGRAATNVIYSGYIRCRQTVQDIQKEIDRLEQDATKNNKSD